MIAPVIKLLSKHFKAKKYYLQIFYVQIFSVQTFSVQILCMHKTKSGNISEPVDSVGEALLIPLPVYLGINRLHLF